MPIYEFFTIKIKRSPPIMDTFCKFNHAVYNKA
jgi:hypothetical protein